MKKIMIDELGTKREYDVVVTFVNDETNKKIVVYTDVNDPEMDMYAVYYDEKNNRIEYIDNSEDQKQVKEMIELFKKEWRQNQC